MNTLPLLLVWCLYKFVPSGRFVDFSVNPDTSQNNLLLRLQHPVRKWTLLCSSRTCDISPRFILLKGFDNFFFYPGIISQMTTACQSVNTTCPQWAQEESPGFPRFCWLLYQPWNSPWHHSLPSPLPEATLCALLTRLDGWPMNHSGVYH